MKSIKGRLLTAFLGIIATLAAASLVFFVINWKATEEYQRIIDTMIAEYRLVHNTSVLIDAFNVQIQSIGTDNTIPRQQITNAKTEIVELTMFLDENITDYQSRSNYLGFKSSIDRLVSLIDESLKKAEQGNITDYFTDYNEANKQYGFVRENGTTLIFSQLQYSNEIQDAIRSSYVLSIASSLGGLLVLILGCIFYALHFARKLSLPLRKLTKASEEIAKGNMSLVMDPSVLNDTIEIRSLAHSFQDMTLKLQESQEKLKKKAEESEERAAELAEKLSEIERMNKLMVNREVKMVRLKEEVRDLKSRLGLPDDKETLVKDGTTEDET